MERVNDFISNREIAVVIWTIVYLAFLIVKNKLILSTFSNVVAALNKAKYSLLILVIAPAIISLGILSLFITLNYDILKTLLLWMISTNLLVHSFGLNSVRDRVTLFRYYKKVLRTIPIIWYIIDLTSFSLFWEMIIVPSIFFINGMYNIDYIKHPENAEVRKIVNFLYAAMCIFWIYSFYLSISNEEFCTKGNLEKFISIPIATVVYMILTYPLILILNYQALYYFVNTIMFDNIKSEFRRKIYLFCKGDIKKLTYIHDYIMLSEFHNSATLSSAINTAIIRYGEK